MENKTEKRKTQTAGVSATPRRKGGEAVKESKVKKGSTGQEKLPTNF